jgi:gliding motility-associated-like protein
VTLELTVLPINRETYDDAICEGDVYDFNGTMISSAGTYVDTVPGTNGCDSIVTLNLTVHPIERTSLTEEICDNEVYDFGGLALNSTGIYFDTLATTFGCDSIITLDLTVHPTYDVVVDEQICDGTTFDFNGDILSTGGTFTQTLTTINGCDSVVTLNLTILAILETSLTDSICDGESLDFNGQILTTSGTYTHTTISSIGCDSVVTFELTVLPINREIYDDAICEGDVYDFNGAILSAAGTYIDTVPGTNGCDSIVTLNLTVHPIERTSLQAEICDGEVFNFEGTDLTVSGTYLDTLASQFGCDSIITLDLVVNPVYDVIIDFTICEGQSYDFNGTLLSVAGTYVDTLTTIAGCDSVRTLNLTVLPILRENISVELCEGEVFDFNGLILDSTGSYIDTLASSIGCDSVVFLDLIVHEIRYSTDSIEICEGETVDFQGAILATSGIYIDTLVSSTGCDSIVTLDLVVHEVYDTLLVYSICEGDSVVVAGKAYTLAGSYTDTLQSIFGCDSVLNISLDVREIRFGEINATICDDISFDFLGTLIDSPGVYVDTIQSSIGCDSIITLNLEVIPVQRYSFVKQVCTGQTYSFLGQVLSATGIYVDTIPAVNGCDSIVTVDLRIVDVIEVDINDTICENDFAIYNGKIYDTAGDFNDTLASVGGCDSVMHINIYVAPIERIAISETICESDTFAFAGAPLTIDGTYYDTLVTRFGCDSIIELDLVVIPIQHTDLSESICEGESFEVGDTSFVVSGSYDVALTSVSTGCDSIVHLELVVIPRSRHTDTIQICEGEVYTFNGVAYDSTGIYIDTLVASTGCDSIDVLDLYVHPLPFSTIMYNLCSGEDVEIDGVTYDRDTTFVLIYAGAYGCDSTVTYEVMFLPDVTLSVSDAEICGGESVQLQIEVTGTDSAEVTWSPIEGLSCTDCLDPIASPEQTTTYTVSTLGCGGVLVEAQVTVVVVPLPGLTVSEDQTIDLGQTVTLQGINEVPTIPISWYDDDTGELLCNDCPNLPRQPKAAGEYHYRASAVNSLGCAEEQVVTITVIDPCEVEKIVAANAFTPNNDGFNDYFEIRNDGVSYISLVQVFNRWGEIVFESNSIDDQWDGNFRGEPVNPGVYMYLLKGDCINGNVFQLAGNVTVIR